MNKQAFDEMRKRYGGGYYPETREEFNKKLDEILATADKSYNDAGEAVVKGLVLMSNYLAHVIGTTGFMHSWAEMQYLSVSRLMKEPWMIVNLENLLYPQYNIKEQLNDFISESKDDIKEAAKERLEESEFPISPNVKRRWRDIINDNYDFKI